MDTRTILNILATADMGETCFQPRIGVGVSGGRRYTLSTADGTVEAIVKHAAWPGAAEAEALAYIVSTLTPGLVDCPPTILRADRSGHAVSVQVWRPEGSTDTGTIDTVLRSDIVGLAAYDWIVANGDRHGRNVLYIPTGHYHHDRIVAIDHGACFMGRTDTRYAAGRMAGLRVPHYIHDHAGRIVGGAAILRDAARAMGRSAWAEETLDRADDWTRMPTFPRW